MSANQPNLDETPVGALDLFQMASDLFQSMQLLLQLLEQMRRFYQLLCIGTFHVYWPIGCVYYSYLELAHRQVYLPPLAYLEFRPRNLRIIRRITLNEGMLRLET